MFTLSQLAGFVAVAEEQHFGRAAERLRMTQPPLSRQIQQLEKELHARLLDRGSRTVRLTPAGEAFLRDARRLLRDSESAALAVRRVTRGEEGLVRIGFTAASAYGTLGDLLEAARDQLPRVELILRELVTRDQLDLLSAGSLDLGLIRPPVGHPELCSRQVLAEPLVAALPSGHPLATEEAALKPTVFDSAAVVMYSPHEARYFHDLLVEVFRAARVSPRYTQYVSQVHTVLALVRVGIGIALVPAAAARLRPDGIVFRPVELPEPQPVELHLAWRHGNEDPARTENPALAAVLDLL